MEKHIAVVKHENNKVTKYQPYASESDANAHVVKYGGFVSPKPDDDRMKYWIVDGETLIFDQSQADSDDAALAAVAYRNDRLDAYPPLGDQLDALWKELNYRRLQGEDLVQDADDMLGAVLAVKSAHPKPE
jgi:hypothetical protein